MDLLLFFALTFLLLVYCQCLCWIPLLHVQPMLTFQQKITSGKQRRIESQQEKNTSGSEVAFCVYQMCWDLVSQSFASVLHSTSKQHFSGSREHASPIQSIPSPKFHSGLHCKGRETSPIGEFQLRIHQTPCPLRTCALTLQFQNTKKHSCIFLTFFAAKSHLSFFSIFYWLFKQYCVVMFNTDIHFLQCIILCSTHSLW